MLGGRSDFEFRKTPISHRTRILARSRSVRLTASSAGEALHVPAAGLAAAGSPYLRECTFSFVRLRFPRRACRLTSLLSRRRGAQPCLSAASDTQSRPLSFRMQYLYARCAASHLLPLPRAASIAPLRRAGVSVCPPVCLRVGRAVSPAFPRGDGFRVPAFPRRGSASADVRCFSRFSASGVSTPPSAPRAVQPEYLSGMGRRTSPHGSSSRTLIQSSHAESSRFV